jgi:predicted nuclease of restriction endonuclease-like (RecB) superfamily
VTKATKGKPGKHGLMKVPPPSLIARPAGYAEWLAEVKARVHAAQQRAARATNHELLRLYWGIGRDILDRQAVGTWGDGILDQVSADLRAEFPAMKGFSRSNLKYMRAFAEAWPEPEVGQQPVGQIPWGHNLVLLTKLKDRAARLAYAASALEHGWSRAVLVHHIEARTVERQGKAVTNFAEYALRDSRKPIGIAEYQLFEALPKDLEASLPSVEMIERELGEMGDG